MVQKKFREIKDWNEWIRLWEKNDVEEIAISLLHTGPGVYQFSSHDTPGRGLENELERVSFYVRVAWMDEHPRNTPERIVGNKAYEILVHILFWNLVERMKEHWASDLQSEREALVWGEIIDFFAHSKRNFSLDGEPYRSKARIFLTSLHSSLKDKAREPFLFDRETKELLSQKKGELARALVNLELFGHILQEGIFEAIPILKEKIAHQWWDYRPREAEMKKVFPEGREKWTEELENFRSGAFRFALTRQEKEARVLMELIVRRAVPVST